MSREQLAGFLARASADADLARQFEQQQSPADVVALAGREGFDVSTEDLAALGGTARELSDDELASVSGGGGVMGTIFGVFKQSTKSASEDADYWKKKLGL